MKQYITLFAGFPCWCIKHLKMAIFLKLHKYFLINRYSYILLYGERGALSHLILAYFLTLSITIVVIQTEPQYTLFQKYSEYEVLKIYGIADWTTIYTVPKIFWIWSTYNIRYCRLNHNIHCSINIPNLKYLQYTVLQTEPWAWSVWGYRRVQQWHCSLLPRSNLYQHHRILPLLLSYRIQGIGYTVIPPVSTP